MAHSVDAEMSCRRFDKTDNSVVQDYKFNCIIVFNVNVTVPSLMVRGNYLKINIVFKFTVCLMLINKSKNKKRKLTSQCSFDIFLEVKVILILF